MNVEDFFKMGRASKPPEHDFQIMVQAVGNYSPSSYPCSICGIIIGEVTAIRSFELYDKVLCPDCIYEEWYKQQEDHNGYR